MSTSKHIVQDREILFATITSVRLALTFVVIIVTLFIALIIIESEQFTFPHFENLEVGAVIPVCLKSSNCTNDNTFCPQESDDNEYYYTRLKTNNLRVLLISNPSIDWSSASMSVGVGSIDNPEKIDGLALSKIQGMDLEITTAAALRGHSRGYSSPEKITALPSNRTVNTSIDLINTSIGLINTSIETHAALAFSFMHAL